MTFFERFLCPRRLKIGTVIFGIAMTAVGCAERSETGSIDSYYEDGVYQRVSDPIQFTEQAYDPSEFGGDIPISDLLSLFPSNDPVWYGFGVEDQNNYPIQGDCDPGRTNSETIVQGLSELPAVIEGIVTHHPRHFQKITVCGSEERYYGSYILQDASGGIQVMKDSRVAEFNYGDHVRLRVRGITKSFDTLAVLSFDQEEKLTTSETRKPVYYQTLERAFSDSDRYQTFRIVGEVVSEATNNNFNEMALQSLDDPSVQWLVSLDQELGKRRAAPAVGDVVQITGPVVNSFGLRILVASLGQIEYISEDN